MKSWISDKEWSFKSKQKENNMSNKTTSEKPSDTAEKIAHTSGPWVAKRGELERVLIYLIDREGKIMKLPCSQCGAQEAEKHHPDYSQPLLIVWLCSSCHRQLHAKAEGK